MKNQKRHNLETIPEAPPVIMRPNQSEQEIREWYKNERNHRKATTSMSVRQLVLEWCRLHPNSRLALRVNAILAHESAVPKAPAALLAREGK